MKKVLITGVSGFVGQHLIKHLHQNGEYDIIGTSRSTDQTLEGVTIENLDLLDSQAASQLIATQKPDFIYHLAALTSPAQSFKTPGDTITNNILAQLHILDALKQQEIHNTRVMVISTSEIYGIVDPSELPINEDAPLRPPSPYAVSKIAQDYLAYQYHLSYKLDIIRVRPFNHIGPGQSDRFAIASFAKQIAEIEKEKKEPLLKVGNLQAKRDFTDVRDVVRAYVLLMEKGASGEVYNIGCGKSHKIGDLLHMLISNSTEEIKVERDPERFRPVDFLDVTCDASKLHKLTGWKPEIPIEQTIHDVLDYWRKIV